MALYVVQVPDPPAGFDFTTMVPGQYFWDVTGITAELTTGGGSTFPNCLDVSGNGNDATYNGFSSSFGPGLVPGNDALYASGYPGDQINSTFPIVDVSQPFTVIGWYAFTTPPLLSDFDLAGYGIGAPSFRGGWQLVVDAALPTRFSVFGTKVGPATSAWRTAPGTVPYDGLPHMVAVAFTPGGAPQNVLYLDGVALPLTTVDGPFIFEGPSDGWSWNIGESPHVTDELAIVPGALTAGQVAALYAAGAAFATYDPAVMALTPHVYYHLDNGGTSTGRQPTLVVSDGTHETLAIPSGFPATALPGPYRYTWQPALNADAQSTDGTITTVAIPPLKIPAGYTVGTRTLDIAPGDQWSNIALWWDDAYMQSLPEFNPYVYPPGVRLVYQQNGAGP